MRRPITFAYLASYALSLLGNSIAAVALPLIVLKATGSVLGAGAIAASTVIPAVIAGLLMGVVIDRVNRRTSSIVTDLVSAASVAALPMMDMVFGLSLGWFIFFGVIGAFGDVPGMTAREAILPAIVRHSGVSPERLLGIREALGAVVLLLGPAAAGTLMTLFDGSTVLWITAATSLSAALLTLLVPWRVGMVSAKDEATTNAGRGGWMQLRDGWSVLFHSPFLMVTTTLSLLSVLVLAALQGLILPVYFTLMDAPGMLGFVLTALASGMLLGGVVYAVIGSRGRRRAWFLAGLIGSTVGFGMIVALLSIWVVFIGAFVVGLSSGLFGSLIGVLMVERIPEHMRGRIMGTQNAILTTAPAAGIVASAVLTEFFGVRVAAVALVSLWLIALVLGFASPSLRSLENRGEATVKGDENAQR